jgi:predicted NBD/HSP70 family sugar kinase
MDSLWTGRISASAITEKFAKAKDIESADGVMLFDAYEAGDADAKQVLDEFAINAATGILGLQSVLDLKRYAIGGGISARPETTQLIANAVDSVFDPGAGFLPFSKPEIVTCKFGNEANLIGALAFHLAQ